MAGEPDDLTTDRALPLVHQGWAQLQLQRPLAAWAVWQQALRLSPGDPAATEALEHLENAGALPFAARRAYRFRPPGRDDRRARWDAAFRTRVMADLDAAVDAFAELAEADPEDPAAMFNLALCLAWQGRNRDAIDTLDDYVQLAATEDPDGAADAWTLAEVLRHGAGAEDLADELKATLRLDWPDAPREVATLDEPGRIQHRPISADPSTAAYEWLDRPMPDAADIRSADDLPVCRATIVRRPGTLEISTTSRPDQRWVEERLAKALDVGATPIDFDWTLTPLPLPFLDAALWTFRLPPDLDPDTRSRWTREAIERYLEDDWVHGDRQGLASINDPIPRSPLAAAREAQAGSPVARARLEGLIRLREQLAARPHMAHLASGYPFDRLRRRLGLPPRDPSTVDSGDLSCASEAELEALDPSTLDRAALLEAGRSASALGRDDLVTRFAEARPQPESRP